MKLRISFFLVLLLVLSGCNADNKIHSLELSKEQKQPVLKGNIKSMWRKAEVRYFDFEGGFYGLIAENGDKLLPMNLGKNFKQHGAIIEFQGHIIKDMMTTKQWGQAFNITQVKLIKAGRSTDQPAF